MATEPMDAIALLKADHRKVEGLFEKFESAKGAAKKQALTRRFAPSSWCTRRSKRKSMNEAYVEHDAGKVTIAELRSAHPDDRFYDAKMKVLSEQIKHHVHEEELRFEGMFAQARAAASTWMRLEKKWRPARSPCSQSTKRTGYRWPQRARLPGTN